VHFYRFFFKLGARLFAKEFEVASSLNTSVLCPGEDHCSESGRLCFTIDYSPKRLVYSAVLRLGIANEPWSVCFAHACLG